MKSISLADQEVTLLFNSKPYVFPARQVVEIEESLLKHFIGDWQIPTAPEIARIKFKTSEICPRDKIFAIDGDRLRNVSQTIFIPEELRGHIIKEEIEETVEIPEELSLIDNTVKVPGGKYIGQPWTEILSPENFDKAYWVIAKRRMKNIPEDINARLSELLNNS